jgi:cation diffusion facilitator CzcD-associated flavoprotein CzcO
MYKNLHTNLPKDVMAYTDLNIEDDVDFPHHTVICAYLEKVWTASGSTDSMRRRYNVMHLNGLPHAYTTHAVRRCQQSAGQH